jgi:RNA polymerase sigma factor (sigma-70 family)
MHSRQTIIEIFSTFVQFSDDRFHSWATDAKLRRSIQACVSKIPQEINENYWSLYWYNSLQSDVLGVYAKQHLIAYLQEVCYYSSQKTANTFSSTQYKLPDCFQIAIASVDKIFKGFKANAGYNLKNYASITFSNLIRETLRQRQEIDICTPWGLLRKISQKRLVESLQLAGLSADTVKAYIQAWNCFKTYYVPTPGSSTRQLSYPDKSTWEAIIKAYNSHITQQILESWLLNCAKCVRDYLYPQVTSINISPTGQDTEWLDNLPGEESVLTQIIFQEEEKVRNSQKTEINTILTETISKLEPQTQQMLEMWYRQGLTQQQIAKQLEMQQYTVSRRYSKIRESLLKALTQWSKETLHISITPDILKNISIVIEEWLQTHYS